MLSGKKTALDYFRKQPDPKELVRKWQSEIRAEQRAIERQIREIQRDEKLAQKQCRESAKRGDMASARLLARELVHTKKVLLMLFPIFIVCLPQMPDINLSMCSVFVAYPD